MSATPGFLNFAILKVSFIATPSLIFKVQESFVYMKTLVIKVNEYSYV